MSDINSFETCKYIKTGAWHYLLGGETSNPQKPASIKVADFPQKATPKQPTQNTPTKKHKKSNAIIISTLIAAAAGYIIFRGFSYGPVARWAERTASMLDDKAYDLMTNNKSLSTIQRVYLGIVQKVKHGLQKFNALSNITAVKDSALQHTSKYKGFGWIKTASTKITNAFKKIVISAYDGVYKKSMGIIDTNSAHISNVLCNMSKQLPPEKLTQRITINGVEKTVAEWLNIAQNSAHSITPEFQKGFSSFARGRRIQKFDKATENFDEVIFSKIKSLKEMVNDGTYITEKASRRFIKEGLGEVSKVKNSISQSIEDITNFALENLSKIKSEISPKDTTSRSMIRALQKQIKQYHALPSTAEMQQRQKLTENITSTIKELTEHLTQNGKSETVEILNAILDKLTVSNQKGHLENILTIVRAIAGKNSKPYIDVIIPSNKIRGALKDMTKIEAALYNKFAELNTGSAPTDILGLAVPTATGIYLVSKGENKQERISSTLKQGIPILGGILTCLYCTLKMKTGLYGLTLGAATSYVLNQIGDKINNAYKKRIEDNKFKSAAVEYYMKNYVNAKKS